MSFEGVAADCFPPAFPDTFDAVVVVVVVVAVAAVVVVVVVVVGGGGGGGGELAEVVFCLCFTDKGNGGGGISELSTEVVLDDAASPSFPVSSPEAGGEANRAVGRGPDEDGPLDFFRIGCGGGGLEEEGVNPFFPPEETDPWSEASRGDRVDSLLP